MTHTNKAEGVMNIQRSLGIKIGYIETITESDFIGDDIFDFDLVEGDLLKNARGTSLKFLDDDNEKIESNVTTSFGDLKYYAFGSGSQSLTISKVDLRRVRLNCPPGYYDDSLGESDKCKACPPGTYQPRRRQEHCLLSDTGFYQNEEAAIEQKLCPPPMYSDEMGMTHCLHCPHDRTTDSTESRQHPDSINRGCPYKCVNKFTTVVNFQ